LEQSCHYSPSVGWSVGLSDSMTISASILISLPQRKAFGPAVWCKKQFVFDFDARRRLKGTFTMRRIVVIFSDTRSSLDMISVSKERSDELCRDLNKTMS